MDEERRHEKTVPPAQGESSPAPGRAKAPEAAPAAGPVSPAAPSAAEADPDRDRDNRKGGYGTG